MPSLLRYEEEREGRPLPETTGDDVLFSESYAAARSLKSAWTRMASTYGCMMVQLSRETLTIKPHWYARWITGLLGLDLCHEIPLSNIRFVAERGKWFSRGKIELHFAATGGEEGKILLYLKKHDEFMKVMKGAVFS